MLFTEMDRCCTYPSSRARSITQTTRRILIDFSLQPLPPPLLTKLPPLTKEFFIRITSAARILTDNHRDLRSIRRVEKVGKLVVYENEFGTAVLEDVGNFWDGETGIDGCYYSAGCENGLMRIGYHGPVFECIVVRF